MMALQHILVPTDFSEPSEAAVRYGKAFADNFGAALTLLHVIEPLSIYAWTSPEGSLPALASVRDDLENSAREHLQRILTGAERDRYRAKLVLLDGSPFLEIIRFARSQDVDLIVMGTHGRGPIAHMLMGSVAEKVVRKAPCPVLTVRHPEHEFVMP
jgi:nucleotide-binding universal stress UspA family protein